MLKKLLFISTLGFFDCLRNRRLPNQCSTLGGVFGIWGHRSIGVGRGAPSQHARYAAPHSVRFSDGNSIRRRP